MAGLRRTQPVPLPLLSPFATACLRLPQGQNSLSRRSWAAIFCQIVRLISVQPACILHSPLLECIQLDWIIRSLCISQITTPSHCPGHCIQTRKNMPLKVVKRKAKGQSPSRTLNVTTRCSLTILAAVFSDDDTWVDADSRPGKRTRVSALTVDGDEKKSTPGTSKYVSLYLPDMTQPC